MQRTQLLRQLIQQEGWSRTLVFVASKHAAEMVAEKLSKTGMQAEALHGERSQGRRTRVLQSFKQSSAEEGARVLVATDVAGRGIHVDGVSHVVNYNLPEDPEDYVHRIGRTGRAGHIWRINSVAT